MICPQEERLLDIGKIPLTVSEVFSCKWFQSHSLQLEALLMSGVFSRTAAQPVHLRIQDHPL